MRSQHIAERLAAEPRRIEAPPFMQTRVMAAIDRAGKDPADAFPFRWIALRGALALGMTTLALTLLLRFLARPDHETAAGTSFPPEPELVEKTADFLDGQKLLDFGETIDRPLQRELNYVMSDARTAVQVLASHFLPEPPSAD